MKKIATIICAILMQAFCFSQTIETAFPIDEAVIYPQNILIRSSKEISLVKGQNTIILNNLSQFVIPNTVNFWAETEFTLLDIQFNKVLKNKMLIELCNDSIKYFDNQLNHLKRMEDILQEQMKELENHNKNATNKDKLLEANDRIKWIDYLQSKKIQLLSLFDSIGKQKDFYLEKQESFYDVIELQNKNDRGQLIIQISAKNAGINKFHLSYMTLNAGWEPVFEINYNDNENTLELIKKARIFQNTGIDLQNVAIFIKTNLLKNKYERPLMFPVYLSYQKKEIIEYNYSLQSTGGSLRNYEVDKEELSSSNQFKNYINDINLALEKQKIDSTGFKTISDKNIQLSGETALGIFNLKSEQKITYPVSLTKISPIITKVLIPCKDKNTYNIAKIARADNFLKDSASIKLFKNHQYQGEANYFTDALADSVLIPLSIDNLISTEYIETNNSSYAKLFGKYRFETKAHMIAIKNHNPFEVKLNVFDQIPVGSQSIDVEAVNLSNGKYSPGSGKIEWLLNIKPGEIKILRIAYAVKYLKGNTLYLNN